MNDTEYERMKQESDGGRILWHYTGYDAFHGIVRKHKLHASDIRYLNDSSEIDHLIGVMVSVMSELARL
jgi:hypothetical protein